MGKLLKFAISAESHRRRRAFFWFLSQNRQSRGSYEHVATSRRTPRAMERNFSASLPIIVSGIDRTPQFLLTGSRSAAKSVCGRENIDDYHDGRMGLDAKLSSTQDITVKILSDRPASYQHPVKRWRRRRPDNFDGQLNPRIARVINIHWLASYASLEPSRREIVLKCRVYRSSCLKTYN